MLTADVARMCVARRTTHPTRCGSQRYRGDQHGAIGSAGSSRPAAASRSAASGELAAGSTAGIYSAAVPNRIIAYIIDFIVLFIGLVIVALIVNAAVPSTTDFGTVAN